MASRADRDPDPWSSDQTRRQLAPTPHSLALTARAPIVAVCAHGNVSGIDPAADKISVDSVQDLATRWLSLRSARLAMDALRPFGEAGPWGGALGSVRFLLPRPVYFLDETYQSATALPPLPRSQV
jgi:hypothetical protein